MLKTKSVKRGSFANDDSDEEMSGPEVRGPNIVHT